jgi:hypothetical protein
MLNLKQYIIESADYILTVSDIKKIQSGQIEVSGLMMNNHIKSKDLAANIIKICKDIIIIDSACITDSGVLKELFDNVDDRYIVAGEELSKIDPNEENIDDLEDELLNNYGIDDENDGNLDDNTDDINKNIRILFDDFCMNTRQSFDIKKYYFITINDDKAIIMYENSNKKIINKIK